MAYRVRLFAGRAVPEYIQRGDQQNLGTGAALSSFLSLPGGGFYDNYQDRHSPQGIRPITKAGVLWGTDAELRAELQAWRALLGVRDKLTVEWDDGTLMWQWARLQDVDAPRPSNAKANWLPITLTWVTAAQNWRGVVYGDADWTWGDDSWVFGDGTAAMGEGAQEFTLTAADATVTVTHGGSIDAANVVLRLETADTWQDLTIVNETTGQQIAIDRTATAAGPMLEIDAGARTVYLGGNAVGISSASRTQNTLSVSASVPDLATNDTVRLAGTGEYDGDYYPVTVVSSSSFTVLLSPSHPGYGPVTAGFAQRLENIYGRLTISDKARWLVLAPGANVLRFTWSPAPTSVALRVEFTEHYA